MRKKLNTIVLLGSLLNISLLHAATVNVDCDTGESLAAALMTAVPGTIIQVTGICNQPSLYIDIDDITLIGNTGTQPATISGFFPQDRVTVDGARRVHVEGFNIINGVSGISGTANASFTLTDVNISDNIFGLSLDQGANVLMVGSVNITNNQVFGLDVINGSNVKLQDNAKLQISGSIVGGQIANNSVFFASRGAEVVVRNNSSIGFSVNTGSSGFLFNAKLHTHDNGADGFDVVSSSNFDIDSDAELISENNGRDGISVDNSTLNLFGFLATQANLPRITSNNNTRNGFQVENTSKLDIGQNSSIVALNNGGAGVNLDDGSSAVLQRSDINNNNGQLPEMFGKDEQANVHADVVVNFGSRVSFKQNADNGGAITQNNIGLAICDPSSLSRGDIQCRKRRD